MKIRGIYEVSQIDRTLDEQTLRDQALVAILKQVGEQAMAAFGSSIRLEAPSLKYPFGRYVIDLDISLLAGGEDDPGPEAPEGVSTITQ